MTVTATDTTVSTLTDYEFSIENTDGVDITAGSVIVISFPTDYLGLLTNGAYNCSYTAWFQPVTLSCSFNGVTLTVADGFPVDRLAFGQIDLYNFVVYNITNPPYAVYTDVFNGEFDSASGTQLTTMQSNGGSGILLTAGALTCGLTVSPTTVGNKAILTISIGPKHNVPTDGKLIIKTNSYWLRDALNSTKIFDSTAQCSASSGAAGNLGCVLTDDVINKIQTLTVSNLVSAVSTASFSFSVSPFNNPPTTEPQGTFSMQTQSSSGKAIDVCSGVKLSTVTTGQLTSPSFSMSATLINTVGQATLTFKLATTILISDTIQVTFPSALTLSITSIILISGNRAITSYSVIGQQLSFVIGTGTTQFQANTILTFTISSIGNPVSTATTGTFSISTARSNYNIDTLAQSLTYTATSGVLSASLSATVLEIGATSVYTLQVTFTNKISATGKLYVTFPAVFTMSSGSYVCTSNTSASASCSYSSSSNTMTVSSISTSGLSSGAVVLITLSGIVNPLSVGSFQSLSLVSTYSSSTDTVDTLSSGLSLTLTTRTLPASSVGLGSTTYTVYTLTTFSFTITNQNPLKASSLLYIVIPPEIDYSGSYSCMKGTLGVSCSNSTYNSQACLLVSLGNGATIAAGALASTPITLSNVYTPTSTKQTSTFQMYLVYSDGTRSEQLTGGLFFTATTPSTFSTLKVTASSIQNYYSPTSFVVSVATAFQITNGTLLKVNFPTVMACTAVCSAVSSWLQTPTCSNNSNILTTQLSFSTTGIKSFDLSLDNMKNFPSLTSYSVKITMTSSDGIYQISEDTYMLQNTLPNIITINSYSFSSYILKDSSSLSISLSPTVPLGSTDYLLLTFPSQFTLSSPTCTLTSQLSCSTTSSTIKVTSTGVFPSTIAITIAGLTNPSVSPSSAIFVESYSSTSSLYDQDYSIKFTRVCTAYCRTCLTTNTSSCLTCYSDGTLVSGNTILSGTVCTSGCTTGSYYNTTTSACAACSSNCTECISYSGCTACPPTYYLYNQMCVSGCPLGYYTDSVTQSCVVCTTALHCETCSTSLYCSSCVSGFLLYGKYCLSNCPSLITTEDSFNRVCQPCPTNCTQCTGTTFVTCIKCTAGYLLDQGGCYLTCKTPNTVPSSDGLTCTTCSTTCLTCSGTQYNCLSCNTSSANKYLYSSNCLSSCGAGYYGDNTLFTCVRCNAPCDTCQNASTTSCLSCLTGSYLYGTTCTSGCPSEYFQNGSICSACQDPCKECTSTTVCTSCVSGKVLYQTSCSVSCPTNTVDQNGVCVNCSTNCKTCQATANLCASCYATNYLLNGVCYQTCPPNYYPNDTTTNCERCVSPCLTCSSSTLCASCTTGFSLDGSSCVGSCPSGKISVAQVCTTCNSQCLTCVGTVAACTSCQTGLLYNQDLSTCTASCQTGYYKYAPSSTCIAVCPSLYYAGTTECLSCPSLCTVCSSASSCSGCTTGSYFYNSMCYSGCPPSAPYPTSDGRSCQTCSITNCFACSAALCISCQSGYLNILNTSCISGCPTNQTYNSTSQQCQTVVVPNNTNTTNNTSTNTTTDTTTAVKLSFVPVPYLIVTLVVVGVVAVGKLQHENMRFSSSILPFVSCLCLFAAITNGLMIVLNSSPVIFSIDLYLLIGGVGFIFFLNFVNQIFVCTFLRQDPAYQEFLALHCCGIGTVVLLSLVSSFKWMQILHSNCFGFAVFGLVLSEESFINKFQGLQWASILASVVFIGSGCINALQSSYSKYIFYGGIELVVLSLFQIALTIASNRSAVPYELKYKETLSQHLQEEIKQDHESHNEIYSQNNIKDLSHEALDSNHLNIFDVIGPQALEDAKIEEQRAESASIYKQHTEMAASLHDDHVQYQSALEFNHIDPLKVEKKHIQKALEEGVFRHNAKSILETKRKEEDESALADAVKLYHLEMKRKVEAEELNQRSSHSREVRAAQASPPPQMQTKYETPDDKIDDNGDEEEAQEEVDLGAAQQAEELQMIIFDDGEELKSVPTHISKEPSSKKRLNSLGSLALIIQEDAQQLDQINLDSDRVKEKDVPKPVIAEQTPAKLPPIENNSPKKLPPKRQPTPAPQQPRLQDTPNLLPQLQASSKQAPHQVQPQASVKLPQILEPPPAKRPPLPKQIQNDDGKGKPVKKQKTLRSSVQVQLTVDAEKAPEGTGITQRKVASLNNPKPKNETPVPALQHVEPSSAESMLIDEPSQHQILVENNQDLLFSGGDENHEIINNSPRLLPKEEKIPLKQEQTKKTIGRVVISRYDDAMQDEEILSPTLSRPKQRSPSPERQLDKPYHHGNLPKKSTSPAPPETQLKQAQKFLFKTSPNPKQQLVIIDESAHGDMIEGYREVDQDIDEDNLNSEVGSVKKLVPVTATLQQQKANLKSKLIVKKPEFEEPEIPIIVQHGSPRKNKDDLESIYTAEDVDYKDTRKPQKNPVSRLSFQTERRYLDGDHDQDLVRPSELFRGKSIHRPDNLSVGGEPALLRPNNISKLQLLHRKQG